MNAQQFLVTLPGKSSMDTFIKAMLLLLVVYFCYQILQPFLLPIVWGAIIAIALMPLVKGLMKRFSLSQGKGSMLVTLVALAALLIPTVWFSGAVFSTTQEVATSVTEGTLVIPHPEASVAEIPVVGEPLHKAWSLSATNLESALETYAPQVKAFVSSGLSAVGSLGGSVVQFIISILISGVVMSNAGRCKAMANKVVSRLLGDKGEEYVGLSIATVRSVVQGVIGVAVIQAVLAGLGMGIAGVPAIGLWMLAVLILAIIQLPPILVLGPVMAYLFAVETTTVAVLFTVWGILVSASDAVLKPMLMGRGVDIPMLVILLGALGGMMMSGIIGLFVGAVVLGLGYKLLMTWLEQAESTEQEVTQAALPVAATV